MSEVSWTDPGPDGSSPFALALQYRKTDLVNMLLDLPDMDVSSIVSPDQVQVLREVMQEQMVPECPVCMKTYQKERPVCQCLAGCDSCYQHPTPSVAAG